MYGTDKVKKREPMYLSKIDSSVKKKVAKEAEKRGISPWLMVEYLLAESLGLSGKEATSKLFKK